VGTPITSPFPSGNGLDISFSQKETKILRPYSLIVLLLLFLQEKAQRALPG
jgi:hypothetical protein